jgi:oligopeptide/dipeptide ABC transporter ATP-binding protein
MRGRIAPAAENASFHDERAEQAKTNVLEVRDLTIRFPSRYGATAVVDHISFDLRPGQTLGIVGESGSGKTLVARAVLGLLPTTASIEGSVRISGVEMLHSSRHELAKVRGNFVAPIFQDALSALNPSRKIGDHFKDVSCSAVGEVKEKWLDRATEVLRRVALPDADRVLNSYPHQLSGGMRQRALIALALFLQPSVLIADEPTTALDTLSRREVLNTLRRLRKELGLTIIIISHDISIIRDMASDVAVLYAGQMSELGPVSMLDAPVHPYTRGLMNSVESLRLASRPLKTVEGTVPIVTDFHSGCRFLTRCERASSACSTFPEPVVLGSTAWCHHPYTGASK